MSRIPDLDKINPWEDGLRTGAASIIDAIVSMLERELYKNKGEDVVYEYAIKAVIQKVKDMKID
jgi:ribonucleotide monophosphatase NagD (HAD superfamily)